MITHENNSFPLVTEGRIGGELVQTVDARDLHTFLAVDTRFNDWINSRIRDFGFKEGTDFVPFTENPVKGRPSKEYAITLDMGKELGMVERTPKGKEVRQYFIECERAAKNAGSLRPLKVPTNERISVAREGRLQFKMFRTVAKDIGLKGNQAVLSANRATKMTTGFDVMGALGITHIDAEVNQPDITPTTIADRLNIGGARAANQMLVIHGYQQPLRDAKGRLYYELTPKGERAGGVFKDTDKKSGHGVPIKQLMWAARIVDLLRGDMEREAA